MLVGKKGDRDTSVPLHCRARLFHGPGGVTGFTAARGKPASAHTADALATLVIWTLFSTAFTPWLLVSAPVPPLQDTGTVAHVLRWWVQLAFLPDRFLVLIHALGMQTVMPITRGELEQSGNK